MLESLLATTFCPTKPIKVTSKVGFSSSTVNEKFPSKSVVVPLSVPDSITDAPGSGLPLLSVTFPFTMI